MIYEIAIIIVLIVCIFVWPKSTRAYSSGFTGGAQKSQDAEISVYYPFIETKYFADAVAKYADKKNMEPIFDIKNSEHANMANNRGATDLDIPLPSIQNNGQLMHMMNILQLIHGADFDNADAPAPILLIYGFPPTEFSQLLHSHIPKLRIVHLVPVELEYETAESAAANVVQLIGRPQYKSAKKIKKYDAILNRILQISPIDINDDWINSEHAHSRLIESIQDFIRSEDAIFRIDISDKITESLICGLDISYVYINTHKYKYGATRMDYIKMFHISNEMTFAAYDLLREIPCKKAMPIYKNISLINFYNLQNPDYILRKLPIEKIVIPVFANYRMLPELIITMPEMPPRSILDYYGISGFTELIMKLRFFYFVTAIVGHFKNPDAGKNWCHCRNCACACAILRAADIRITPKILNYPLHIRVSARGLRQDEIARYAKKFIAHKGRHGTTIPDGECRRFCGHY